MLLTERKMETGWDTLSADTESGGRIRSHSRNLTAAKAGCPTRQHTPIASEKRRRSRVDEGIYFIAYSSVVQPLPSSQMTLELIQTGILAGHGAKVSREDALLKKGQDFG